MKSSELIALFDMDGTLVDYDSAIVRDMEALRSPKEPRVSSHPQDSSPAYLRARVDLIRSSVEWWANLPKFKLGFDVWKVTQKLGYRHMILTAGPKRTPNAWTGKKLWIDTNIGQNVDITITRDKGLVYGRILVDDWPAYVKRWLEWRPRGLVIMPAHPHNKGFSHPQVIRYDGTNLQEVRKALEKEAQRGADNG
jgi:5'-nucleotidase